MVSFKNIASAALFASSVSASDCVDTTKLLTSLGTLATDTVSTLEGLLAADAELLGTLTGEVLNATKAVNVGCILTDFTELPTELLSAAHTFLGIISKL